MSNRDLLIFTAVLSSIIIGVTVVGWIYFVKWIRSEEILRQKRAEARKMAASVEDEKNIDVS